MAGPRTRSQASDLGHYVHARLYEQTFRSRKHDVAYFLRVAGAAPLHILEYGAGAGRVTLPLLRAGHQVTAVDASKNMLSLLQERAQRLPRATQSKLATHHGDMRRLRLGARFPLVLATFNVVGHLPTHRDMGEFLRRSKEHLAPGGRLVFDVSLPQPEEIEADPDELHPAPRFKHPDTGEWIRQTERFDYDPLTQTLLVESTLRLERSRDPLVIPLYLRQWFPKEVEAILHYEGFSPVETQADYTEGPGALTTDSMVFIARAPRRTRPPRLTHPPRKRGS